MVPREAQEPNNSKMSLLEKLDKIRSPKLQNQHQVLFGTTLPRLVDSSDRKTDCRCVVRGRRHLERSENRTFPNELFRSSARSSSTVDIFYRRRE